MDLKQNDFIEAVESNGNLRGKVFQIISFGDQRQFGHRQRFARIRNLETKNEMNVEEAMLNKHFKKVDYKNIGSEQKDSDWFLDECRRMDEEANRPKLEDKRTEIPMLPSPEQKCPKCSHSMANHGTVGNSKGKCLVPICSCGNEETKIPEDTIDQIALARRLVRAKCKTLSVRNDRGTAYGWICIRGQRQNRGEFTDEEKKALEELGLRYGMNYANISPENRKYYLRKWLGLPQTEKLEF